MVPYIDVMLVLLVIFMITAPMLTQGVTVDLPKAASTKFKTFRQGAHYSFSDSTGRLLSEHQFDA